MKFTSNHSSPFYFFTIGLFLIVTSKTLLSEGMFMDGLIYSTLAHNLYNGIGTFWNPFFTDTCMADFHEHPPLAFGIQSLFFKLFGDSIIIDKIYSCLTYVIVGYLITKIWSILNYKNAWVPLVFWLLTPLVSWAFSNVMLENTLSVFTTLSILLYLKSKKEKKYYYIFLSGIMLALAFLTKGFVAFFPLTFPFLHWLLFKQQTFLKTILDSFVLFLFAVVPILFLIILSTTVYLSLSKYLYTQVINSILNVDTTESRFFILKRLFFELLPAVGLFLILACLAWYRKFSYPILKHNFTKSALFFLLGLSGVLPIMISRKQSGFYILATFPFFAISLGILSFVLVEFLLSKIRYQSNGFLIFKWISLGIFFIGVILSIYFSDSISRDKNMIEDTHIILSVLNKGTIISIHPNMDDDWVLKGYYGRYKNVSLDPSNKIKRDYLLVKKIYYSDTINNNFNSVLLNTKDYLLFKRK